ncbi:uncharacterized [Tachysurus ichikawai]
MKLHTNRVNEVSMETATIPECRNHAASDHRFPCFHHKSALATRSAYLFTAARFPPGSFMSCRRVSPALLGRGLHRKRAEGRLVRRRVREICLQSVREENVQS